MPRQGVVLFASALALASAGTARAGETLVIELGNTSTTATAAPARGLTLDELCEEARQANLQIKIDQTRIGEARALYEIAASYQFPRATASALFGGPTPEARTTVVNELNTTTPASLENDFDFGDLGVAFRATAEGFQPLYTFGKISSAKDAARHVIRAATHKAAITESEVLLNVHKAFWAYQLTRSFVASLEEGAEILEGVLERVEDLLENDSPQVTENDRLRMIHAKAIVQVRLGEARSATQVALAALKLLVGRGQNDPLEIMPVEIEDQVPEAPPPLTALAVQASTDRPELQALRALIDAHSRYLDHRRNQFWPDLFIGGFLRFAFTSNATDQTNPFLYDEFNYFDAGVGLGIRMELDVFTKLALSEQARAELNTRIAEAAAVEQAIDLEVRKIHTDVSGSYAKIDLLERALRAARGWLSASVLAYDVGAGDAAELIDAFIARATAEGDLKKTLFDVHVGLAEIEKAAGMLTAAK